MGHDGPFSRRETESRWNFQDEPPPPDNLKIDRLTMVTLWNPPWQDLAALAKMSAAQGPWQQDSTGELAAQFAALGFGDPERLRDLSD